MVSACEQDFLLDDWRRCDPHRRLCIYVMQLCDGSCYSGKCDKYGRLGFLALYLDMAVVTCLAVIPPELGKDNFGFPAKILYVPAGSVEVYRKNAVWREAFETIAALP